MTRPVVLLALVDAWRHDWITSDRCPFLDTVRRTGVSGRLMEPFGFNTGPAIFAGLYPERSDQVHKFWFDPDHSPYGFTRFIPEFLFHLPRGSNRLRGWIHGVARRRAHRQGNTAIAHFVDFGGVPDALQRFFDLAEKRNVFEPDCLPSSTIFDVLRAHGREFLYIGVPTHRLGVQSNLADFDAEYTGREDLVYMHFGETDWEGHSHGPDSPRQRAALGAVDSAIRQVAQRLARSGRPVVVVAFGDHGMAPVRRRVDVGAALATLSVRPVRDYAYFLDSTQVRLWYFTPRARAQIRELIATLPHAHLLEASDLARYRIRFGHRRHWDDCVLLDEGAVVAPDFWHPRTPVLGMHGYRPEAEFNQSAFVVGGDVTVSESEPRLDRAVPRPMVDLCPTVLSLLGLPVPEGCQGQSLVRPARTA